MIFGKIGRYFGLVLVRDCFLHHTLVAMLLLLICGKGKSFFRFPFFYLTLNSYIYLFI